MVGHERSGRILIVEDEAAVARAIQDPLEAVGYEVVGVVSRAGPALAIARHVALDLALVDIELPGSDDGVALAAEIGAPVVFVSGHTDDATLARVRATGGRGFVVKPFTPRQLVAAVDLALAPGVSASGLTSAHRALSQIARTLEGAGVLGSAVRAPPLELAAPGLEALSRREREILDELLRHRRPPQIARALGISPHTVRNHLKSIFAKLGVHSQAELLDLLVRAAERPASE